MRDYQFRGTEPEGTIAMWPRCAARRGEVHLPYQEQADAMFNSALPYELPIMKKFVYPMLCRIEPQSPATRWRGGW